MAKKILACFLILASLASLVTIIYLTKTPKKFYLENTYYKSPAMEEIKFDELNNLTKEKKSFAVFIYQPMCVTSSKFETILNDFLKENNISIYKLAYSNIKDTTLVKTIKYYPSFIIYHKGKIVDYLEADKDKDVAAYTTKDGFKEWFTKYVKLKPIKEGNEPPPTTNENNNGEIDISHINLDYLKQEKNKVNIYFFWGDGCPHCEKEKAFFNRIKEEYGAYYNLYTFETWENEDNAKLLKVFAQNMNTTVDGVPFTIIGSKFFSGFTEEREEKIISAIKSEHTQTFDVYFDKIKK